MLASVLAALALVSGVAQAATEIMCPNDPRNIGGGSIFC
jgi:hypothetical protein